jgi:hypothetical protein
MTGLQVYILAAPILLAILAWVAYWWFVRSERKHQQSD